MKKLLIIITAVLLTYPVLINCNSKPHRDLDSGYVKEIDTLFGKHDHNILSINRTFYRKPPTLHNGLLELMQPEGSTYVVAVVKQKNADNFSLFVIEDFKQFLKQVLEVKNDIHADITISIDDMESTYMRKSVTFKNGVFISKEQNRTPSVMFDLSEQDLKDIENAYNLYIKESQKR
ncbi:hypothetical protein [Xanthomarina gelatinilytica]|uniref:hypothetical protein n=1 Tax=Xanthomarina gelatinilytica TaxID=1137281 RepID=UPI003AA9BD4B